MPVVGMLFETATQRAITLRHGHVPPQFHICTVTYIAKCHIISQSFSPSRVILYSPSVFPFRAMELQHPIQVMRIRLGIFFVSPNISRAMSIINPMDRL